MFLPQGPVLHFFDVLLYSSLTVVSRNASVADESLPITSFDLLGVLLALHHRCLIMDDLALEVALQELEGLASVVQVLASGHVYRRQRWPLELSLSFQVLIDIRLCYGRVIYHILKLIVGSVDNAQIARALRRHQFASFLVAALACLDATGTWGVTPVALPVLQPC